MSSRTAASRMDWCRSDGTVWMDEFKALLQQAPNMLATSPPTCTWSCFSSIVQVAVAVAVVVLMGSASLHAPF